MKNKTTHPNTMSHERRVVYNELAAEKRGLILNQTINLEMIIDYKIASYFVQTQEKQHELAECVISSLPLSNKILTLLSLLKKYDDWVLTEYPKIKDDLEKIRKARNEMAHSWLDISVTFVANRLKFNANEMKLMNKGNPKVYDDARIKTLSEMITKYSSILLHA
jgi:hypothetical protein